MDIEYYKIFNIIIYLDTLDTLDTTFNDKPFRCPVSFFLPGNMGHPKKKVRS